MALNASKTIMLEKQYLYVKASKGFQLEGTNIEKIWVNTGYYRFLVDNVAKALSNSYVNILYDPTDIDFIAYCSDLFMEELQNTVVVAVENLQSYVEEFYDRNHDDITELSEGLSGAMQLLLHKDSVGSFLPVTYHWWELQGVNSNYIIPSFEVGSFIVVDSPYHDIHNSYGDFYKNGFKFTDVGVYLILSTDGRSYVMRNRGYSDDIFVPSYYPTVYKIYRLA